MRDLQKGPMFTFIAVSARPVPVLLPFTIVALVQFHELIYLLPVAPVMALLRHRHDLYRNGDFYRTA